MQKIALLGVDIQHSLSPEIQNNLFKKYALNFNYEIVDLKNSSLYAGLQLLKEKNFIGANITSPFKIEIIDYLDFIDNEAKITGSVNTILFHNKLISGFNTDVYGFYESLKNEGITKTNFTCGVIGNGGAARSVLMALLKFNSLQELTIFSRDETKAKELTDYFNKIALKLGVKIEIKSSLIKNMKSPELLINASSAGMNSENELELSKVNYCGANLCYDLVYKRKTNFLRIAEELKIRTKNGLEMLYLQAEKSFTIWTGIDL